MAEHGGAIMGNLNDWLALLPDNSTGDISAADLRTIFTDVWENLSALSARIAIVENTGDEAELTIAGRWQINPVAGGVPQGGQMTCDTNDLSEAVWLRFANFDKNDVDMSHVLVSATAIYAQQRQNAANWTFWNCPTAGAVVGGYVEVPVEFIRGSGSLASAAWQDAIVSFTVPAAAVDAALGWGA